MPPARRNTPKDSLAGAAGDRVRVIIEAAEASAAEIRADAEAEAERIRSEAEERASVVRSEARSDVRALLASIRGSVDSLRADLERLEQRLGEPESESAAEAKPARPAAPVAARPDEPVAAPIEEDLDLALAEDAATGPGDAGGDVEGARLVALNMALDGASRDEISQHLRESHGVSDSGDLLDEVYESIGRS